MTGAELRERLAKRWVDEEEPGEVLTSLADVAAGWWLSAIVAELGITRAWFDADGYLWEHRKDDAADALTTLLDASEGK